MKHLMILCLVIASSLCACKKNEGPAGPKVTSQFVIKIGVNGEIAAGDKQLTPEEFAAELEKLKQTGGGVLYTRDNYPGESTEAQAAVLRMATELEIPTEFKKP